MKYFGYMGNVLYVDLTSGSLAEQPLDPDAARSHLGGMGINAWLMSRIFRSGTSPFSPDNPIILGAGPLVGTGAPGASKVAATTRFPLNGAISESVGSMRFARNLKGAGFDHVVITGRAERPVVLVIGEENVSLMDAGDLWGRDIFETTERLKASRGGPGSSVIAIGPSGENRVVFSLALVDRAATLGRGGLGAVMGSKNLKAVLASGRRRPEIHDPDTLRGLLSSMRERLRRFANHPRVLELGIMENWDNYVRQLTARRNFTAACDPGKATRIYGPEVYRGFGIKRFGCPSCVTPDKDHIRVLEGPYRGFETVTTSYLNSALLGIRFDLNDGGDSSAALRMMDLLDRAGLDFFTFGSMIDFLVTESEQGTLDPARFDLPLGRDFEALSRWVAAISGRKGPASLLADGWEALLRDLGAACRARAPVIRDCDVIWDPRLVGLGTMEFEQVVSLKGPRSQSGGSPTYIPGQTEENLPLFRRHLDRMGADGAAVDRVMDSPVGFNVGRMTRYAEDWYTVLTSLGVCNRHFNNRFYSLELCRRLFAAATGFDLSPDQMRAAPARTWDLLREMNEREGMGSARDRPPDMWFTPMEGPGGESLGLRDYFGRASLDREDVARLIRDYYDERGWAPVKQDQGEPGAADRA